MAVTVFENTTGKAQTFVLDPGDERYELPLLARLGVRYSFDDAADERTFAEIGEYGIRFWCDTMHREIEVVHPTSFDLLLWDCAALGFCGGLVNDEPLHVTDLLPAVGEVTAEEFAELTIRADCASRSSQEKEARWATLLVTAFITRMGAASVPAETLVQNFKQPFEICDKG